MILQMFKKKVPEGTFLYLYLLIIKLWIPAQRGGM